MTPDELEAIKQRTRDAWARHVKASAPCNGTIQIFPDAAAREEFLRQIREAQDSGEVPF